MHKVEALKVIMKLQPISHDLSDMHARNGRVTGLRAEGMYVKQISYPVLQLL